MEKKRGGRGHDGWTLSETPTRVSLQRGRDQKKKKKKEDALIVLYTLVSPMDFCLPLVGKTLS